MLKMDGCQRQEQLLSISLNVELKIVLVFKVLYSLGFFFLLLIKAVCQKCGY